MAYDISKAAALGAEHFKAPTPFCYQVGDGFWGQFWRGGEAIFYVFMALAQQL